MKHSLRALLALILLAALTAAGCGGSDDGGGDTSAATSGTAAATAAADGAAEAPEKITIAYQAIPNGDLIVKQNGWLEEAFPDTEIEWKIFDSGGSVIEAVAANSIDIGLAGSSPVSRGLSTGIAFQVPWIFDVIGEAEALVVRDDIASVEDLKGKKIAAPLASTTHYSLLAALKHEGVDPKSVEILNLRPPEIAAAWERGDIDAAYVWDPALGQIRTSGEIIVDSAKVAEWGAPTFDAWIARKDFSEKHPEAVTGFVRVTGDAYAEYLKDPQAWSTSSEQAQKIAKLTGAKVDDVPLLLKGYVYPSLAEQASADYLGGATAQAIAETSAFLKEQGRIDAVLPDYASYVTTKYVTEAAASN